MFHLSLSRIIFGGHSIYLAHHKQIKVAEKHQQLLTRNLLEEVLQFRVIWVRIPMFVVCGGFSLVISHFHSELFNNHLFVDSVTSTETIWSIQSPALSLIIQLCNVLKSSFGPLLSVSLLRIGKVAFLLSVFLHFFS